MVDLNAKDIEGAMKIIEGSVRSMGLGGSRRIIKLSAYST